ncbi:MAG: flagellar hook-associated protein, partial [Spirochaetales bacterium]|nr:flagellar hook-associated protein [Spirochaetales bacterium]
MSDGVFIPGLSSKYNSGDAIKRIMESKNKKLDKLEDTKKEMNEEKSLWREVRTKTMAFQDKAKKLYGHEAPFDDKISLSSDENAFAAKVTKQAEIGEYRIQ